MLLVICYTMLNFNAQGMLEESPWEKVHKSAFPAIIIPFGALVFYRPPNTGAHAAGKWEGNARKGIFAGYQMRSVTEWSKQYLVWDLSTFKNSDLRTSATYRHQRIGEAFLVGRCELPADRRIVFL